MQDLTRFRRYIRSNYSDNHAIHVLVDAIDQVYENLQTAERDLSNYNCLDSNAIQAYVNTSILDLVRAIVSIGNYEDVYTILKALVDFHGFSDIKTALNSCEPVPAKTEDSLGNLDDHPF